MAFFTPVNKRYENVKPATNSAPNSGTANGVQLNSARREMTNMKARCTRKRRILFPFPNKIGTIVTRTIPSATEIDGTTTLGSGT